MTCCATVWGTRGNPNARALRSTDVEKTGRISGMNQRNITKVNRAVTMRSERTMPRTPMPAQMTRRSRATIVAADRVNVSVMYWVERSPIRSVW
jgi:hypothetical protein